MEDELFEALGRRRRKQWIESARMVRNPSANPDPIPPDDDLVGPLSEFGSDRRIVRSASPKVVP